MGDTSLVFSLSARDNTRGGMRDARQTVEQESEGMAADVGASGGTAGAQFGEALKGGLVGLAAGAGLLLATGLVAAFGEALDQGRIVSRLGAQLGATGPEAQKYGHIAGNLYANAVTEDFQTAADAVSAVMRAGIAPPGATEAQLESLSTKVADLASTFELDLGQTANAVGQMIKTGLAKDGTEALDALTRGLQKMGPRADDIADTFNEYSTIFRQLGLSATDATGLLSQGMKAGARDTDVVADSLKEFVLIAQGGGDKVDAAFKAIGLNGKEMQAVFSKGGPEAEKALDKVFDGLRKVKDPAKQSALAVDLFGTKSEDTQKALMALDPSKATDSLGKVGGAAKKMGDTLRDNAGSRLTAFKRGLQQNVVDYLGGTVLPALTTAKTRISQILGGMWDQAGKGGAQGADRMVAFFEILGQRIHQKIPEWAPKIIDGLTELGQRLAAYVAANPETVLKASVVAGAVIAAFIALPALVLAGIVASVTTIATSFISGLVSRVTSGVPALGVRLRGWFGGLWGTYISGPVSRTGASFMAWVRGLPGRAGAALSALGDRLSARANAGFAMMKSAASQKGTEFIGWVRGLPGRISRGIGNLGSLLRGQGRDVVTGLWRGISSLGGWLWSKVTSFVRTNIMDAAKSFLRIGSPSKLAADEIGRWLPPGIAEGINDNRGVVDESLRGLVAPVLGRGNGPSSAPIAVSPGTGSLTVRIQVEGPESVKRLIREIVAIDGGGNVQAALGST